jgi:crotonobetainyl-CoA:carnitine CoA-transferase CaiB-like acyl-CoA transferase
MLGEHTDEILKERLQMSAADIQTLKNKGVV